MAPDRPTLHLHRPQTPRSRALCAQKAHRRMKQVLEHSAERPWMTWVVLAAVLLPFLLLVGLAFM